MEYIDETNVPWSEFSRASESKISKSETSKFSEPLEVSMISECSSILDSCVISGISGISKFSFSGFSGIGISWSGSWIEREGRKEGSEDTTKSIT